MITLFNRPLRVVIDPGHGGADSGAVGPKGTHEENVVLSIAKILKKELEKDGIQPWLTRTVDTGLQLSQRTGLAKTTKADLFISMHNNAASASSATGIETLHGTGNVKSKTFASVVQGEMMKKFPNAKNRGLKSSPSPGYPRSIYVVRNAPCPSCLVEMEFISNGPMENLLNTAEAQERFAQALAAGIKIYARNFMGAKG